MSGERAQEGEMLEVREILFPSDLSLASAGAFAHARLLAGRLRARLTVYHAVEIPWAVYAREAEHDAELRESFAAKARDELARLSAGVPAVETLVDTAVSPPSAFVDVALLDLIRERRPDLVVMATHARTGLARAFIGSVTEQVVHHSHRPVLCVPPGSKGSLPYRRLLIATDLSSASCQAFPWASRLGREFEAQVLVAHVPARQEPAPDADDVRRFVGGALEGLDFETRVLAPGRAWSAIATLAGDWPADVVIVAGQGRDAVGDRILGSTAERLIRHCPVPVLVA